MTNPGSSQQRFTPPPGGDASRYDEDASVQFEAPPSEGSAEQAAFTVPTETLSGIPSQLLEARSELEQALQQQRRGAGAQSLEAFASEVGNIQGVGIGLGEPDEPGEPGVPTLQVFVAQPTSSKRVRSAVVESMGALAVRDVPMTVRRSGIFDAQPHRFRVRPAPGGVSIGHPRVTAGTLGCLSVGRSSPRNARLLLLSNNHVIANVNNAAAGDCISQPGRVDGGTCPADQIAVLERYVPLLFSGATNFVDCATGWCWPDRVRRELIHLPAGVQEYFRIGGQPVMPQLGWTVGKSGRTTQVTIGRITSLTWSGWVNYNGRQAFFRNQFIVEGLGGAAFSAGGDSGSCVWTWDPARTPVGLLFAGAGAFTLCNPMPWVVSALDIVLFT
jgi:hypothetical protein